MTGPETGRDTDLERIEVALAEGRATATDPRERELQELALALQAESAEPDPGFARELDKRVSEGFPGLRRARLPRPRILRRAWMPALAGAAAVILVAVVTVSLLGGGDRESSSISAALSARTDLSAKAAPEAPGAASAISPFQTAAGGRRVERNARITISTPGAKLQRTADGVGTVAESHRGYVLSSQVSTGDQGSPGGSFTLRVPARELQATLADLSKLGHMRARSESAQDRTVPYRNVQDRLGNALIERTTLRIKLRHAHGAKADTIRARIAALDSTIAGLSGQMRDLRNRTLYSTVDVTLEQETGTGAGGTGLGGAWHDALHTLQGLVAFLVRALGVLVPLGLLAGLAVLGTRALRRRRREAALM
jgi:uncharacterized protein DUF4349